MKPIFLAAVAYGLMVSTVALAIDPSPPPTDDDAETENPRSRRPGGDRPLGGGSSQPPSGGGGGGGNPGFFSDIEGKPMPVVYCVVSEPCEAGANFTNLGAPLAADQPIPDPTWKFNGHAEAPQSVERSGASGPGWPSLDMRTWTGRFVLPAGTHALRAAMPQLANEKEADNNVATGQVIVGQPDMAIKLKRKNVDMNTRYEIKAEVQNKGTVPTQALSVLAVLVVNTHASTPPTPSQCMQDPNLSGCVVEKHTVDSLAPGEKKRWKIGGKQLATNSVKARAQVACKNPGPCADQDPDNNTANKVFGP